MERNAHLSGAVGPVVWRAEDVGGVTRTVDGREVRLTPLPDSGVIRAICYQRSTTRTGGPPCASEASFSCSSFSLTFLVVLAVSGTRAQAALAADCGDGVGPCSCGDTVRTDTTLDDTDPVTATVCPCDGLLVASGVELNLGGHTISGSGVCVGVRSALLGVASALRSAAAGSPDSAQVSIPTSKGAALGSTTCRSSRTRSGVSLSRNPAVPSRTASSAGTADRYRTEYWERPSRRWPSPALPRRGQSRLRHRCWLPGDRRPGERRPPKHRARYRGVLPRDHGEFQSRRQQRAGLSVRVEPFIHVPALGRAECRSSKSSRGVEIDGESVLVDRNQSKTTGGTGSRSPEQVTPSRSATRSGTMRTGSWCWPRNSRRSNATAATTTGCGAFATRRWTMVPGGRRTPTPAIAALETRPASPRPPASASDAFPAVRNSGLRRRGDPRRRSRLGGRRGSGSIRSDTVLDVAS